MYGGGKYILYDDYVDWSTPSKTENFGGHISYSTDGINWTQSGIIFYKRWSDTTDGYQFNTNDYCIYANGYYYYWQLKK